MANKRKASSDSDSGIVAKVSRLRSPTAYNLFLKSSWKNDNKKDKYSKFAKECSQKWADMGNEQKQVFVEEAASLKCKLDEEKEKKKVKDGTKKSKRDGGSEKKKRPPGPYIIFCNEIRDKVKGEHPEWAMTDISKELGRRWNALTTSEKGKYQAKATEGKEKYLKDNAKAKGKEDEKAKTSKRVDEKQDDSD